MAGCGCAQGGEGGGGGRCGGEGEERWEKGAAEGVGDALVVMSALPSR